MVYLNELNQQKLKMKIEFRGNEFELDVEKAIISGSLKPVHRKIVDFTVGDVFVPLDKSSGHSKLIVVAGNYTNFPQNRKYIFVGNNGLNPFSVLGKDGVSLTFEEVLRYLNQNKMVLESNINSIVEKYIKSES